MWKLQSSGKCLFVENYSQARRSVAILSSLLRFFFLFQKTGIRVRSKRCVLRARRPVRARPAASRSWLGTIPERNLSLAIRIVGSSNWQDNQHSSKKYKALKELRNFFPTRIRRAAAVSGVAPTPLPAIGKTWTIFFYFPSPSFESVHGDSVMDHWHAVNRRRTRICQTRGNDVETSWSQSLSQLDRRRGSGSKKLERKNGHGGLAEKAKWHISHFYASCSANPVTV